MLLITVVYESRTMKAMNFQDGIPSIPFDNFKHHYVLLIDLTSRKDADENCHYPELVGEPLRLEPNFTFPPEQVTEVTVLGERTSLVAVEKFCNVRKIIWNGYCFSPANSQSYPTTQVSVPCFNSFWLCFNSWQGHVCYYQHGIQQNAGWALDNDCKVLSWNVFCSFS